MHNRKQIITNQVQFKSEITAFLKNEFREMKRELNKIDSSDPEIMAGKSSLVKKAQKVNITEEINKLFISWKNVTPAFYAWWDESTEQVFKLKYTDL